MDKGFSVKGIEQGNTRVTSSTNASSALNRQTARNILLHFAPRDIRKLNGIFRLLSPHEHQAWLAHCIDVSVFLCGEWCLINPGTLDECAIAAQAFLSREIYIADGLIRFSMRE